MRILLIFLFLLLFSEISLASSSFIGSVIGINNYPPEIMQISLETNNIFQTSNQFYVTNPTNIDLVINVKDNNGYEDISFVRFKVIDVNDDSNKIIGDDFIYLEPSQTFVINAIYSYELELLPTHRPSTYILYVEAQDGNYLVSSQQEFIIQNRNTIPTGFVIRDTFSRGMSSILSRFLSIFYKNL